MLPRIYHEVNQETVKLFVFGFDIEVFIITCIVKYAISLFCYIRNLTANEQIKVSIWQKCTSLNIRAVWLVHKLWLRVRAMKSQSTEIETLTLHEIVVVAVVFYREFCVLL
jgi:hypothetical protein